jgi:hypothetical protein
VEFVVNIKLQRNKHVHASDEHESTCAEWIKSCFSSEYVFDTSLCTFALLLFTEPEGSVLHLQEPGSESYKAVSN